MNSDNNQNMNNNYNQNNMNGYNQNVMPNMNNYNQVNMQVPNQGMMNNQPMNYNQFNNNQNTMQPNNVEKKPKKKKKHRFLKFLLIVLLIFAGFRTYKYFANKNEQKKLNDFLEKSYKTLPIDENEEVPEELLDKDINNDGLTYRKKVELGLNPINTDTDGDGLSDAEELNTYHSDPKKYSTSGDLLSDAYKVKNNMDVTKKYSDTPEIKVNNDKIKLTANRAEDIEVVYKEYNGSIPSDYYLGMKPFKLYSFKGTVNVKVDNPDYYEVYSYNNLNNKTEKIKSKKTNDTLEFSVSNDNPILIAYKNSVVDDLIEARYTFEDFGNTQSYEYVVIAMPFFNYFFKTPIQIFQVTDSNHAEVSAQLLEKELTNEYKDELSFKVSNMHPSAVKLLDSIFNKLIDNISSYNEEGFLEYLLVYRHFSNKSELYAYLTSKESTEEENTEDEEEDSYEYSFEAIWNNKNTNCSYCADSGFELSVNSFVFSNLSTAVSSGGVCLGMAHVATRIYNNANILRKFWDYDLRDNVYNTIFAKKIHNYTPSGDLATYSDDIYNNEVFLNSSKMPKPDSEVVKLIEYYFSRINFEQIVSGYKSEWNFNHTFNNKTPIRSSAVDNLRTYFKEGKIASAVFLKSGAQHAVNVYKMTEDKDDSDIIYLKVYDNNFPDDYFFVTSKGQTYRTKFDVKITLKRYYKNNYWTGKEESYYLFEYAPYKFFNNQSVYDSINEGTDYLYFLSENGVWL